MSLVDHHVTGREYWLSLEHHGQDPALQERISQEFPGYDPEALQKLSRRGFLRFAGGALALAGLGLAGCRRYPEERLAPFASRPEGRVPGELERYATSLEIDGVSTGLLATSHDGRPIKLEGNPSHPDSLGATNMIAQASVLDLYDPDRSRGPSEKLSPEGRRSRSWDAFERFARSHFASLKGEKSAGLAILCEPTPSATFADSRRRFSQTFPQCGWYEHQPLDRRNSLEGSRRAFGQRLRPVYHLDRASVMALFDADLLGDHPAALRHARDWARGRRSADSGAMNRVLIAESAFSTTGTIADHRLPVHPRRLEAVLRSCASRLGVGADSGIELTTQERDFVERVVQATEATPRNVVFAVGERASPEAHELACRLNLHLGTVGTTVTFVEEPPTDAKSLHELREAIEADDVKTLVILGGNPVYDAPADIDCARLLGQVATTIHLSLYRDETSRACNWHLPLAHFLESWGDGRAWDGTVSVSQPLIFPLHGGRSRDELLALLRGDTVRDGYDLVRRALRDRLPEPFERSWRRAVHDGVIPGSRWDDVAPAATEPPSPGESTAAGDGKRAEPAPDGEPPFDVVFQADSRLHDGRFANNAWLQEAPDPLTKVTWDNPARLAPRDAARLGLRTGDVVRLTVDGRSLEAPVFVLPGQPEGVVGLPLGHGRRVAGRIGSGVGYDAYRIRTSRARWVAATKVQPTGRRYELASTQDHHAIDDVAAAAIASRVGARGESGSIVREATLRQYASGALARPDHGHESADARLFDPPREASDTHAWGMAIDMNSCIGCNACMLACQAENNIPVVGKEEVAKNRDMHWIRVDRYFKGDPAGEAPPDVVHQPMTCVHCENAPCEQVCPVAATVHDTEGLNTMVYNRCIGTRYCANNCPYKVRRFNYFDYHSKDPRGAANPWLGMPDSQQLVTVDQLKQTAFNPDVTVRMRGVMEKCTYCVHRIAAKKSERRNEDRPLEDGDVVTACQQACPTQAIVFGDLNDPQSEVSKLHESDRAYAVLGELNVRPRTKHLAKIRNPVEIEAKPGGQTS